MPKLKEIHVKIYDNTIGFGARRAIINKTVLADSAETVEWNLLMDIQTNSYFKSLSGISTFIDTETKVTHRKNKMFPLGIKYVAGTENIHNVTVKIDKRLTPLEKSNFNYLVKNSLSFFTKPAQRTL